MVRRAWVLLFALGTVAGCSSKRKNEPTVPPPSPGTRPAPRSHDAAPPTPGRGVAGERAWVPGGGKISPRWSTVVIHHSATATGSARTFDRYHRDKGWDELGYHFVIGNGSETPDGMIEVGTRWYKQKHGAHCKTADNFFNEHGIGICLVGDFTRTQPTPRQLAALERLAAFLCDRCGIPPTRVVTHGAVTHKTACPGRNFPLATVRRALLASYAVSMAY